MRILLVEDMTDLAEAVTKGLENSGFSVDAVGTAGDALASAETMLYDLIILDLGLPDMNGLDCLRLLRGQGKNTPVLILTARDGIDDRVTGLDAGADDYLLKPFAMPELIARLRALLRRPGSSLGLMLNCDNLNFDSVARQTAVNGVVVPLSRREMDMLEQLLRRVGNVVPKTVIEDRLYGYDDAGSSNSIEVLLSRLRKKLTAAGADCSIHTVRGVGYMLAGSKT